ncbi:MAG: LexA family protein [Candidatus Zixiibacteriota bacterium]
MPIIHDDKIYDESKIPLFDSSVQAGFPSPANDYIDRKLDLNELLIEHPTATFFVRVEGQSMTGAGIHHGDILIVDRALEAKDNKIVIAIIDGELSVKRIKIKGKKIALYPENPDYEPIEIDDAMDFMVWGVVKSVIHEV